MAHAGRGASCATASRPATCACTRWRPTARPASSSSWSCPLVRQRDPAGPPRGRSSWSRSWLASGDQMRAALLRRSLRDHLGPGLDGPRPRVLHDAQDLRRGQRAGSGARSARPPRRRRCWSPCSRAACSSWPTSCAGSRCRWRSTSSASRPTPPTAAGCAWSRTSTPTSPAGPWCWSRTSSTPGSPSPTSWRQLRAPRPGVAARSARSSTSRPAGSCPCRSTYVGFEIARRVRPRLRPRLPGPLPQPRRRRGRRSAALAADPDAYVGRALPRRSTG